MKNNQLERFPSMLSSVRVRHLSAHLCNINTIDLDAFEELRHELESIDLSENKISQVSCTLMHSILGRPNLSYCLVDSQSP